MAQFHRQVITVFVIISIYSGGILGGGGKYSKEKNQLKQEKINLEKEQVEKRPTGPFRIAKLNAIWEKAQRKLSPDELRTLLDDLQVQDKEEITLKRLSNEGGDKDGSMAEELRDRLHLIMDKHGLLKGTKENVPQDKKVTKRDAKSRDKETPKPKRFTFKDKKLTKLWEKAQRAGFSEAELENLKSEFGHHQKKLDEYYEVYEGKNADANGDNQENDSPGPRIMDEWNDLDSELSAAELEDQVPSPVRSAEDDGLKLDTKLRDITKNYAHLTNRVNRKLPDNEEADFTENKVEELWNEAIAAGFDRHELSSLREELRHFEQKLKKLKHMNDQIRARGVKHQPDQVEKNSEKSEDRVDLETKAKHFAQKTDNLQKQLERKIANRHNEL